MAHLVTGYAGKPHVIPQNQADMNARVIGAGCFMLGGGITATKKSNSSIEISADGCLMAYGRQIEIETEAVTITTGTSGKFRKDYIVMTYSMDNETGVETAFLQVLKGDEASTKGTVVAPSYTDVTIDGEVTFSQILLFSVDMNGIDIEAITKELGTVVDAPINEMKEINDETPTYEESKDLSQLTSGEKISVAFGKLKKAVASLISHIADMEIHITEEERTEWNAKASGTALSNHISDKENPHGVTASQVGALSSETKYAASSSVGGAALSCEGNSATASKLETARKINGIDFDGSEDITLPEVTEVAKADVAGKLESAVKINGVEFDGSHDITLPAATHTATADEATKAEQDAEGNVITDTYATIESLTNTNEIVAENADGIAELNNNLSQLENANNFGNIPLHIVNNSYYEKTNGSILDYEGWSRIDLINCKGASTVEIDAINGSTYNVFLAEDNTFISSFTIQEGKNKITIPSNACYFGISSTTENINNFTIKNFGISQVNDSLGDYGLDNVFDGQFLQGYYGTDNLNFVSDEYRIASKKYPCSAGDLIKIKTSIQYGQITVVYNTGDRAGDTKMTTPHDTLEVVVPSGATSFGVYLFNNVIITPSQGGHMGIYINNAIDELKSDLGGVRFGIDSDGNYGYIKAGADTVIPFKSGGGEIVLEELASDSASVTNGSFTKTVSAERQSSTGEDIQGFITIIDESNTTGYATLSFDSGTHETTLFSKDVSSSADTVGKFRVFYDENDGSEGTFDVTISGSIGTDSTQYMKANIKIIGVYAK